MYNHEQGWARSLDAGQGDKAMSEDLDGDGVRAQAIPAHDLSVCRSYFFIHEIKNTCIFVRKTIVAYTLSTACVLCEQENCK